MEFSKVSKSTEINLESLKGVINGSSCVAKSDIKFRFKESKLLRVS